MRKFNQTSWRVKAGAIFSAVLVLFGAVYAISQIAHPVVGLAEDPRLSVAANDAKETFTSQTPVAITVTNQVDPTATVSLQLPTGVSVDWTATQKLWGSDHAATQNGQALIAADQTLHVTTTPSGPVVTLAWPHQTAATVKLSLALQVAASVNTITLQPKIGTAVLGTKRVLTSTAAPAAAASSTAAAATGSATTGTKAPAPAPAPTPQPAPAPTPAGGTLSVTSGNASYLFADNSLIPVVVTNTQTPGAVVTVGLGGTTLDWAKTYQAWKAMDPSTTSNDDFTALTTDSGASLTLKTQAGQQVVALYMPTSGTHAGSVPLTVKPSAGLSDFTLTPVLADGTKGTAGQWRHITIIDPDTEESTLYAWLENTKGNEATKFKVGATGVVHIRVENLTQHNAIVQLPAATTLDFSKTKLVAADNTTVTSKYTATATGGTYTYTLVHTSPDHTTNTSHVVVTYDQQDQRITVSSADGGGPELYFYFTINAGGGNSGYTVQAYMDDGIDGRTWTMQVTGDVTPAAERVQIKKVDAQTPTTTLAGAQFQLTDTQDASDDQTSAATDSSGLTTIVPKNAGVRTLRLKEVTAPPGYSTAPGTYEVQWSKLLGITAVRVPGETWAQRTSDGVLSVKDNQLTFNDSKTGQITVQEYDRSTHTMLATNTYTGENGQALTASHPGANVPATHEGLTIWGTTMGSVDGPLDPYAADNLPDPVFSATPQTLTYVYDRQMFELDPDATLEFGQFAPTATTENYLIGAHARATAQPLPFGATVIDRIGVGSWQLSVAQDDQFMHDSDQTPLTDARLWFKNLQVTSTGGNTAAMTQFQTQPQFTLVPKAKPTAIVSAKVAPTADETVGTQQWRVNFGSQTTGGQSVGLYVPNTTTRLNGHYSTVLTWTADQLP
ncbi:SpaA isopeptide-forming pilin-related protein [Lacticaseibacillus baoqingensis]|uniref:SpaA isopeptide-forming pilin-related protein n=1 Tax=Lacticaseibacillus baoqingensis TaxID=2486013 RepID=A0ABW4E1X6_9LACO|nr:SpaA isopeptide-forming pilin-related protein [Lacticaseibacillus baoqingensis]